jgi:hypothetical protein
MLNISVAPHRKRKKDFQPSILKALIARSFAILTQARELARRLEGIEARLDELEKRLTGGGAKRAQEASLAVCQLDTGLVQWSMDIDTRRFLRQDAGKELALRTPLFYSTN